MNKLGSRDEAEDALQSTFLNAHRALQRGVVPESELAWLYTIAHNVCLTRRRSTRRRGRVESPSDLAAVQDVMPARPQESPEDLMRLTEALEHMPDSQRRAILLREWQGLSYHEIADELELTQSAVETLIFRARRTLASNLESQQGRFGAVSRMRKALDAGALLAALKGLFEGGAAAKVALVAVAASGTVAVATAPPTPVSKPAPQKQAAAAALSQAASARIVFDRPQMQATRSSAAPTKSAPVVHAPAATDAKTPPAAVAARPEKQKPKHEPKATPPGRAKKLAPPPTARSNGHAVKEKPEQAKVKGPRVERLPAPAQAPQQLVAPAAPPAQSEDSVKDKGPKK